MFFDKVGEYIEGIFNILVEISQQNPYLINGEDPASIPGQAYRTVRESIGKCRPFVLGAYINFSAGFRPQRVTWHDLRHKI
jgi:hypothetical protein